MVNTLNESLKSCQLPQWADVFRSIAQHPQITLKVLEDLARLGSSEARIGLAKEEAALHILKKNFDASSKLLERILQFFLKQSCSYSHKAACYLLQHPSISVEVLEQLATHSENSIRKSVAMNPSTPVEILKNFSTQTETREAVAENPNTPPEVLLKLVFYPNPNVRKGLASNTKAPLVILETLADDEFYDCRAILASNPSLPFKLLDKFSNSSDLIVLIGVAANPNATHQILLKLSAMDSSYVRLKLLERADLSEKILENLAENTFRQMQLKDLQTSQEDQEDIVLHRIAAHPKTPAYILEMLTFEDSELFRKYMNWFAIFVFKSVASNPNTPIVVLKKFVTHTSYELAVLFKENLRKRSMNSFII